VTTQLHTATFVLTQSAVAPRLRSGAWRQLELWFLGLVPDEGTFRSLREGTLRSHPSITFPDRPITADQVFAAQVSGFFGAQGPSLSSESLRRVPHISRIVLALMEALGGKSTPHRQADQSPSLRLTGLGDLGAYDFEIHAGAPYRDFGLIDAV
jgi:hypothetical protein